ncbi:MAG: hypothetical protein A2808_02405 [Candidatus Moranbacteria bacterium RIFCSPHIGHO2_01_FULL_55_24]|nr:MAG: hypothetical protein A2808_02405 [Candidatus Moranbacteria bacterium RIFCSPHIGHO2_01_FULL_55_24]
MKLFVTAKTNAREERVEEVDETHFKVSVKAAPLEGKANKAIAKALARHLSIAPSRLTLRSGASGRSKVFDCV